MNKIAIELITKHEVLEFEKFCVLLGIDGIQGNKLIETLGKNIVTYGFFPYRYIKLNPKNKIK